MSNKTRNKIMMIKPYIYEDEWVFDDADRGLVKELLVSGIPEIIDFVCQSKAIPDYQNGFKVIFSDEPFPEAATVLDFSHKDESGSGHWYDLRGTEMKGWLCPALMLYFDDAPKSIYLNAK